MLQLIPVGAQRCLKALVFVGGVDHWLEANYMFLWHKPDTASVI
ncbi:hypothetical protein [Paenibacillus baimaensis]|nr:hypothetical protein [Paenibacillus sp. WQ 127069]